jgi:hypothetical protein
MKECLYQENKDPAEKNDEDKDNKDEDSPVEKKLKLF